MEQPAPSTSFPPSPRFYVPSTPQQQKMVRHKLGQRLITSSTSTTGSRLAIAISILQLKPSHLTFFEFLTFLRQVIPVNSRLRDVNPIDFYRQLSAFSSSRLLELRLELREVKVAAELQEPMPAALKAAKAQSGKKRKSVEDKQPTTETTVKKRKPEPSNIYRPLATLKPYVPLIQCGMVA
jgi:hypothetical protein